MKRFSPLVAALAAILLTQGCASPGPDRGTDDGPWSSAIQQARDTATSDLQRQVLEDGRITDAEYQELMQAFESCVTSNGLTLSWVGEDGGFTVDGDDQTQQEPILTKCTRETEGEVTMLYREMRRNPNRLDEREIMAACLARVGLVDKSYTAKDYERDFTSDTKPPYFQGELFNRCNADPLGAKA